MNYLSTKVGQKRFKWTIVIAFLLSFCGLAQSNSLSYEQLVQVAGQKAIQDVAWQNAWFDHVQMNKAMDEKLNESILKKRKEYKRKAYASDGEFEMFACLIYAEAGGQPYYDQVRVAEVVLNRVSDPRYPNSIYAVITQEGQFVPARSDGTIVNGFGRVLSIQDIPDSCIQAAQEALNGSRYLSKDTLEFRGSNGEMVFF